MRRAHLGGARPALLGPGPPRPRRPRAGGLGRDRLTRFVLLSHWRTGSQLLRTGLEQHPRVLALNELFHASEEARRAHHRNDDGTWLDEGEDGAAFLARVMAPRPGKDAVGFKLAYRDGMRGSFASVWQALAEDRELRVVHLERAQRLESLVSLELAHATDEWMVYRDEARARPEPPPIHLSPERVRAYIDAMERDRQRALERLRDAPRIDLEYRALVERYQETLDQVFEHLGVAPCPVEKRIVKQAARPLRERIANFDELARELAGTPYARYFEP